MAAAVQRPGAGVAPTDSPLHAVATPSGRLAAAMLVRGAGSAPSHYAFAFTPFLQTTYKHGLPADRPVCRAYSTSGTCPLGSRCPDRHLAPAAAAAAIAAGASYTLIGGSGSNNPHHGGGSHGRDQGGFNSLVCKHWLRGLCKKGEGCEFLHEYNLRKMPECNFFLRNGYCSNGDECLYLHIDPRSKLPPCPDYDNRGFCALGPTCPKKHVRRKAICPYFLAGFCPDGMRVCKEGAHPKWTPVAIVARQVAAEKAAAEAAAAEAALRGETLDEGGGQPGSPFVGGDDYNMGGTGDHQQHDMDQNPYQQQHQRPGHHMDAGGDDVSSIAGSDRTARGDHRGGFRDRGRGGRWRGRGGGGRGFRGRGRGDH